MNVFELFAILKLDKSMYEAGLKDAQKDATSAGSKIGGALRTGVKVAGVALTAASAVVTKIGKAAITTSLSFDSAMGEVAATAGKTAEELAETTGSVDTAFGHFEGTLRDLAKFMGKNTAFTASQAAQALNYMALAGYDTQQSMSMLPKVLDMAAAGAMDLGRASDMITDISSALGLNVGVEEDVKRIELMVDEFAKAAASGNTTVEMLGDAFLTVGGLAKEVNGGFITMADGTKAPVDGLQQLEIAFTAMANAGIKGSEAGTHMRNILLKLANPTKQGIEAFDKMGVSIFDAAGEMKPLNVLFGEMNAAMSTMSQQEKLSAIGDIFNARDTASAEALLGAVTQSWDVLGEKILDAKGSASQMAETKLNNLQGDITKFKSALEGAQITMSDGLTPTLRKFVQFGTSGLSKLTQAFEDGGMGGAMEAFGEILSEGLNLFFAELPKVVDAGGRLLEALGKGLLDNLDVITDAAVEVIIMLANGIVNALPKIVQAAVTIIIKLAEGIAQALPDLVPAIVQAIMYICEVLTSPDNLTAILKAALDLVTQLMWGLVAAIPVLVEGVAQIISNLVTFLVDPENIVLIIGAALSLMMALAEGLINAVPVILAAIPEIIVNIFTGFVDAIINTDWLQLGIDILSGIANGLWKGLTSLFDVIGNIGESIIGKFKSIFGIASPSKVFRKEVGKNLGLGLAEGIDESTRDVEKAMDNMMDAATGEIENSVDVNGGTMKIDHTGTIRLEGVNDQGEFVAASEYVIEDIVVNILRKQARLA